MVQVWVIMKRPGKVFKIQTPDSCPRLLSCSHAPFCGISSQASLMRALAQVQLKSSPETKQAVEERFNLSDEKETKGSKGKAQGSKSSQQAGGEESSEDSTTEAAAGEGSDSEGGVSEEAAVVVVQPKKFVPARRDRRAAAQQLRQKEAELAEASNQNSE